MSTSRSGKKPTSPPKTVLVVGATGRQGRAVVSSLFLRSNFRILALTRNPGASSSRSLLNRKWSSEPVDALLELVQGDLDKPLTIRKIFEAEGNGGIAAVFVALAFPGLGARADKEERQGIVSLFFLSLLCIHMLFLKCCVEWAVTDSCVPCSYWQILPLNLAYRTLYSQALREVVKALIICSRWIVWQKPGLNDISND